MKYDLKCRIWKKNIISANEQHASHPGNQMLSQSVYGRIAGDESTSHGSLLCDSQGYGFIHSLRINN